MINAGATHVGVATDHVIESFRNGLWPGYKTGAGVDPALLGGVSNGPFYEMKRTPERLLEADRLTRISYLVGIFKALRILHDRDLADEWVHMPNSNPIFAGRTPLSYMIRGGLPAMQTVRRLLDARRAG